MTHDLVEGARVPHRPQRSRGRRAELRGLLPPHPRRRHHSGQKEEEAEEAEETAGSGGRDFSLQRHGSCIGVGRYDGILDQAKDSELLTTIFKRRPFLLLRIRAPIQLPKKSLEKPLEKTLEISYTGKTPKMGTLDILQNQI